jgi:radical SAM superfamily enzyme YgiQ (UPF0313 family)
MKVLLISPNSLTTPYPVYPLGLDYVADAIRDDHDVAILDMNPLGNQDALRRAIRESAPDLVGISLRNIDNTDGMNPSGFMGEYAACMDAVRTCCEAPVVLGGSGFTLFPQEIMKELGAEYGIVGEGEKLVELLHTLEAGKDVASVPGILTRNTEPAPFRPLDRAVALNHLPDSTQLAYYLKHGGMLNLQTKRGCPFRCIYCTYPRIEGSRLRRVHPEAVAERALTLQASGAKYFFVTDSAFNADVEHSTLVAKAFMDAGVSIPWGAFFAPTSPPEGYFRTLADAGLSHVEFGTESLSDKMLAVYKKPFRLEQVLEAHKSALDAGLYVAHYFMLGGPGEDEKTVADTLSRVSLLERSVFFFFALCAFIRIRSSMKWPSNRARYRGTSVS